MSPQINACTTPAGPAFKETRWSVVLTAKDLSSPNYEQAMATLCEQYSYPVYAFIRRKGHDAADAEDLAQEFFYRLISKEFLRSVDREKGRFRTFLLTAVQRFLCKEWEKSQAQKRGGGAVFLTWDADAAEQRYCEEPSHDSTPEKLFDRHWALRLLDQAKEDLKSEYKSAGKHKLLEVLQAFIVGENEHTSYAEASAILEMSEGAARVWVHRIRYRYGELVRKRIAETVDSEAAVEEELRTLCSVLGA
jgi:RNA polymerase sigma-70 factor (ECF subfamily)